MKQNDWKSRLGVMYSTNPDYKYQMDEEAEEETLPKEKQRLHITLEKRNRRGSHGFHSVFGISVRAYFFGEFFGHGRSADHYFRLYVSGVSEFYHYFHFRHCGRH